MSDGAAGGDVERASADGRTAAIRARSGEGERAGPELFERAAGAGQAGGKRHSLAVGVDPDRLAGCGADLAGIVDLIGARVLERATAERDRRQARAAPERPGTRHGERAFVDPSHAGKRVVAAEGQRAGPEFRDISAAVDVARVGQGVGAVEDDRPVVADVAADRSGRASVADAERAGGDRRGAEGEFVAGEEERAGAELRDIAVAGDHAAEARRAGAVEDEVGIDGDVPGDRSGGAAVADLERAGCDGRQAGEGVRAGERERAEPRLGERPTGAGQSSGEGDGLAVGVEGVGLAVRSAEAGRVVAGVRRGELKRTAGERDRAGCAEGACAAERNRSGADRCAS